MKKLTGKQQKFIDEYLVDFNATQAAIRAGYKEKTAYSMGQRLLKKVEIQNAFQEAKEKQQERTQITADDVVREIYRLATFDPRKLFHSDGTPKQITELDDETAACIGGMDIVERRVGDEEPEFETTKKLKIWDKNAALEKLCKHFQLYAPDQVHVSNPQGGPVEHEHNHKHEHDVSDPVAELIDEMFANNNVDKDTKTQDDEPEA